MEIVPCLGFIQEDLDTNGAMILDAKTHVFVWFGKGAKPNEKKIAMETALKYVKTSTEHDTKRILVVVTHEYQEPQAFTNHFHGWTKEKFPIEFRNINSSVQPIEEVIKGFMKDIYTLDELLYNPPEHLDKTKLEMYLSEEEFLTKLKITKSEYMALLPWKRERVKKESNFF